MPKITMLDEMLIHDLGDVYDAEHRFLEGQGEMLAAATDRELKKMIKSHMAQTEVHIERLERAYEVLGLKAKRVKCPVAIGLVKEGQDGIEDSEDNPKVRDCLIACAAHKVEHYEISSYRSMIAAVEVSGPAELLEILRRQPHRRGGNRGQNRGEHSRAALEGRRQAQARHGEGESRRSFVDPSLHRRVSRRGRGDAAEVAVKAKCLVFSLCDHRALPRPLRETLDPSSSGIERFIRSCPLSLALAPYFGIC